MTDFLRLNTYFDTSLLVLYAYFVFTENLVNWKVLKLLTS